MKRAGQRYEAIEFEGLGKLRVPTERQRAALRRRFGYKTDPFNKQPTSTHLPRKVHTALQRARKKIVRDGSYTCAYELLVRALKLKV